MSVFLGEELMKSNAFLSGPTVALGLALTLFGAPAARAALVFNWSGNCVLGCPAGEVVTAELELDQNYVFGSAITNDNFVELTFRSPNLNQFINTLDDPAIGINTDGSLVGNAIVFEEGQKLFTFQASGGGLNWTAGAPGGITLRGLGASRFTPAGVLNVPEPSTWAMMLLGFAGLGYAGYRRARRAAAQAAA
jgi:PEP-CTERM motif